MVTSPRRDLGLRLLQSYVRSFPVSRGKQRLASLLWQPLSNGHYQRETTLRGSTVEVKCDLRQFIQRQLYLFGAYEELYCNYWSSLARNATTIFDVGANIGLYSLLASEANRGAAVHAFEPTPEVVDQLKANLALNGFSNVRVNDVAVGRNSGQAVLRECRGSDGANEGMNYVVSNTDDTQACRYVSIVSLDDYCLANEIESIDLLKIDIEGGEYDALVGARNLLDSQAIRCLMVEFTEWAAQRSGHTTADLRHLLEKAGYTLHRLSKGKLTELDGEVIDEGENVIAISASELASRRSKESQYTN